MIKMHEVRKVALQTFGLPVKKENYYKLPSNFGTHPSTFKVDGLRFKVLSSAEAKATSKTKASKPHRILVWCDKHSRWIFAGKHAQHCRITH